MVRKHRELISLISNPNGTSRIELSRTTGSSPAKIGKLVRHLVKAGLLTEVEPKETLRGRRPMLLKLSKDLGYLIGLDVGMSRFHGVLTDMQGNVVESAHGPSGSRSDAGTAIEGLILKTEEMLARSKVPREKLLGIGISHSAAVHPETGACLYWHGAMHWKGFPFRDRFSEHFGIQCRVLGSAHCMGLAEKYYGSARDADSFLLVNLGQAITSSLFVNGRQYSGVSGLPGELGHMTVAPDGPLCSCGSHGCLHVFASAGAVMEKAVGAVRSKVTTSLLEKSPDPASLTMADICEAARSGDRFAVRILEEAGSHAGTILGNMVNLLNPPLMVLAGGMAEAARELYMSPIERRVKVMVCGSCHSKTRIVFSSLDGFSGARGAALMMAAPVLEQTWENAFRRRR